MASVVSCELLGCKLAPGGAAGTEGSCEHRDRPAVRVQIYCLWERVGYRS